MTGGRGNARCDQMGGKCTVTLRPGEGLRELKSTIRKVCRHLQNQTAVPGEPSRVPTSRVPSPRQTFGKYPSHTLSKLTINGAEVKKPNLVDGCTVACHYGFAPGNAGALHGGRRGRFGGGGGFGGFGRRMGLPDRMLLAMLQGRGGFAF